MAKGQEKKGSVADLVSRIAARDDAEREEIMQKVARAGAGEEETEEKFDWKVFLVRFATTYPSHTKFLPIAMLLYLATFGQLFYQFFFKG